MRKKKKVIASETRYILMCKKLVLTEKIYTHIYLPKYIYIYNSAKKKWSRCLCNSIHY